MLALLVVNGSELRAQSTASLSGVVRDSSGAAIAGATVSLQNAENGTKRDGASNDSGIYVFADVAPGRYSLSVSKQGFGPATVSNVSVLVNQASTQDFTLNPGTIKQAVTVEAPAVALQTANAALGTVIENKAVSDLPLNGRNFTQLLSLTPGVSPVSVAQNSGGAQASPIGSFVFPSVNGQTNRSNYFMYDGIDDTDQVFTTYAVPPILDDIQEFKVQSHNDEVQFGGVLGGIINVISKSGTNDFRGTVWEFLRNSALDARNPLLPSTTPLKQNQFGFNFGGPVVLPHYNGRNRTFFYGSYEGFRRSTSTGATFYNVPTSAELQGDLSSLTTSNGTQIPIYNPFSTRADPTRPGSVIRDPFPNNQIPSNLLDPRAVGFAKAVFPGAIPLINGFNGYDSRSVLTPQNEYSLRFDENFNDSNSAFFRFSSFDQPITGPGGFQGLNSLTDTFGNQYVLSYFHIFSPSTLVSFNFGHVELSHNNQTTFPGLTASSVNQAAGFASNFACGFAGGISNCLIPSVSISGFVSGGEGVSNTKLTDIYQWRGDFTKVIGNHTITTGFNIENNHFQVLNTSAAIGFAASQTSDPSNPGATGSALASFLLGVPDSSSRRQTIAPVNGQRTLGFYIMDGWKATDRLTVNIGLRYDLALNPTYGSRSNGTDAIGDINFNNGTYILQRSVGSCADLGQAPCVPGGLPQSNVVVSKDGHLFNNTYDNVQPRLGLAYRLNNKTVVRASFGLFNDLWAGITQTVQGIGGTWPSIGQLQALNQNAPNGPPNTPWENPLASLGSGAFPAATPFQQVGYYRDPSAKDPTSAQWNFGVQRQLGSSTVLTANYAGSHSSRLTVGGLYNVALIPGPGTAAEVQARRPYPDITPTNYDRSIGKSSYNGLQFSLNHQVSHGFGYIASYTWSKAIDLGCSGFFGVEGCSIPDPYHLMSDRSVAGFDLTHVFSFSSTAELPFGQGKRFASQNRVVDAVIGGWQLNGIVTLTSGQPYSLSISQDVANTGIGYDRLNLIGDAHPSNPTPSEWFNTAAVTAPAPYTFGNLGRNAFRADWSKNLDLSIFRSFPLGEKRRLEFRAESFNLTNTPTWGIPVSDIHNPNFGRVLGTRSTERQLQFALKLYF